jgi:osmoprotectant transport system substrate-binding protein
MRMSRRLALGASALALVLSACTAGGGSQSPSGSAGSSGPADLPDVTVGSDGFYESALVAEIYAQALEAKGFTVNRKLELGTRDVRLGAFTSGQINLMPEYIGSGVLFLADSFGLEGEATADTAETLSTLQGQLAELDPPSVAFDASPGTDADGFVVTQETADQFSLTTMSDLAKVAKELTWGLPAECGENPACGPGLKDVYGIDINDLDVNNYAACDVPMAEALNAGEIQVAEVCTTQPAIETFNLVLMEDDGGLAPAQNLAPVASKFLADAGGATFSDTLNAVSALLTTEELTSLGVEVAVNQTSYADAAHAFLEDNGLM